MIRESISYLVSGRHLTMEEAATVMQAADHGSIPAVTQSDAVHPLYRHFGKGIRLGRLITTAQ